VSTGESDSNDRMLLCENCLCMCAKRKSIKIQKSHSAHSAQRKERSLIFHSHSNSIHDHSEHVHGEHAAHRVHSAHSTVSIASVIAIRHVDSIAGELIFTIPEKEWLTFESKQIIANNRTLTNIRILRIAPTTFDVDSTILKFAASFLGNIPANSKPRNSDESRDLTKKRQRGDSIEREEQAKFELHSNFKFNVYSEDRKASFDWSLDVLPNREMARDVGLVDERAAVSEVRVRVRGLCAVGGEECSIGEISMRSYFKQDEIELDLS
jgi:hypothetical protein